MSERDPQGQHIAVGNALLTMGALGIGLGVVLSALGFVGTGFIDGPTCIALGVITGATGAWQRSLARGYED